MALNLIRMQFEKWKEFLRPTLSSIEQCFYMMSDSAFHLFVETVSLLGVAGGLVYTGVQLHNWRDAQYVTNFTKPMVAS